MADNFRTIVIVQTTVAEAAKHWSCLVCTWRTFMFRVFIKMFPLNDQHSAISPAFFSFCNSKSSPARWLVRSSFTKIRCVSVVALCVLRLARVLNTASRRRSDLNRTMTVRGRPSGIRRPILCTRSISSVCILGINFMLSFRIRKSSFSSSGVPTASEIPSNLRLIFCYIVLACHFVVLETLLSFPGRLFYFLSVQLLCITVQSLQ